MQRENFLSSNVISEYNMLQQLNEMLFLMLLVMTSLAANLYKSHLVSTTNLT